MTMKSNEGTNPLQKQSLDKKPVDQTISAGSYPKPKPKPQGGGKKK